MSEMEERFTPMMDALTKLRMAKSILKKDKGIHRKWPEDEQSAARALIVTCQEIAEAFDH